MVKERMIDLGTEAIEVIHEILPDRLNITVFFFSS